MWKHLLLASQIALLSACGSSDNDNNDSTNNIPNTPAVTLSQTLALAPGDACPAGGVSIQLGFDKNANGALDEDEVSSNQTLCHGASSTQSSGKLVQIGRYESGLFDQGGAEIVAFDAATRKLFVVNAAQASVDVLDLSNPSSPQKLTSIEIKNAGVAGFNAGSANSVAVHNGVLAVAVEADNQQDLGRAFFYSTDTLSLLNSVPVGALPDMMTFSPDGRYALTANEGQPNDDYSQDPEGSIAIIDLSSGVTNASVKIAHFQDFNSQAAALKQAGVRLFGPNASVAQDLEPEYITISQDSSKAWVTLQENNALAIVDIAAAKVTDIVPLGVKDHSREGQGIDGVRDDKQALIRPEPVFGMYMPDAIANYRFNGSTYLVTANEGDAREYGNFSEESSARKLTFDSTAFSADELARLTDADGLGDLTVSKVDGKNAAGEHEKVYSYGARSFSIWTDKGQLVFDSGDQLERLIAQITPLYFNASNSNNKVDDRSDNKGPEPEGVALGEIDGHTYAYIGLERQGGVMVYDITNPYAPNFVQYSSNRDFSIDIDAIEAGTLAAGAAGDLAPEGLLFIAAKDSPNGEALVVVGNEVSGTTTIYAVR